MKKIHPSDVQELKQTKSLLQVSVGEGPRLLGPHAGVLSALAQLFQRCSEICNRVAKNEHAPALTFYMMGMAHAHWIDAIRARELTAPTVSGKPPENFKGFIDAYEAVLALVRTTAFASNNKGSPEETVEEFEMSLRERAAGL